MPSKSDTDNLSANADILKRIIENAESYEKYARDLAALSRQIERKAKDLNNQYEKIGNIRISSTNQKFKRLIKTTKGYEKWMGKRTKENIQKKRDLTDKLNKGVKSLNDLLGQLERLNNNEAPKPSETRTQISDFIANNFITDEEHIIMEGQQNSD